MQQSKLVLTSTKQLIEETTSGDIDIDSPLCFMRFEVYEIYMEQGKEDCIKNMFNLFAESELIINDELLKLRNREDDTDITVFNIDKEEEGTKGFFKAYKENKFIKVSISLNVQTDVISNFYGLWFKDKWDIFNIQQDNTNNKQIN